MCQAQDTNTKSLSYTRRKDKTMILNTGIESLKCTEAESFHEAPSTEAENVFAHKHETESCSQTHRWIVSIA